MPREPTVVDRYPAWHFAGIWLGRVVAIGFGLVAVAALSGLAAGAGVASFRAFLQVFG